MRLGIVLAATGAAVTAWAVATAQDGFDAGGVRPADPAAGRTIHYFSRNGATSRRAAATGQGCSVTAPPPGPLIRASAEARGWRCNRAGSRGTR